MGAGASSGVAGGGEAAWGDGWLQWRCECCTTLNLVSEAVCDRCSTVRGGADATALVGLRAAEGELLIVAADDADGMEDGFLLGPDGGPLRGVGAGVGGLSDRRLRELRESSLLGSPAPFLSRSAGAASMASAAASASAGSAALPAPALSVRSGGPGPVPSLAGRRSPDLPAGAPLPGLTRGQKRAITRERAAARVAQAALTAARDEAGSREYRLAARAEAVEAGVAQRAPLELPRVAHRVPLELPRVAAGGSGKSGAKKMRSALAKAAAKEAVRAAEAAARHARNVKKKAKKRDSARAVAAVAVAESALASSSSLVAAAEAAAGSELARSAGMAAASAMAQSAAPVPAAVAALRVVGGFGAPNAPVAAARGLSVGHRGFGSAAARGLSAGVRLPLFPARLPARAAFAAGVSRRRRAVRFRGACDHEFLVDSGAGETIVTPGVAAQWGAPERESIQVVDANQRVIQAAGGAPLYGWVHDDSGARVRVSVGASRVHGS